MTEAAAAEALEWLLAHRGKPLTAEAYFRRDAPNRSEVESVGPAPAELMPLSQPEGAWRLIVEGWDATIERNQLAGARVVHDRRVVIESGSGRILLDVSGD
jgi:hypothetical protein